MDRDRIEGLANVIIDDEWLKSAWHVSEYVQILQDTDFEEIESYVAAGDAQALLVAYRTALRKVMLPEALLEAEKRLEEWAKEEKAYAEEEW